MSTNFIGFAPSDYISITTDAIYPASMLFPNQFLNGEVLHRKISHRFYIVRVAYLNYAKVLIKFLYSFSKEKTYTECRVRVCCVRLCVL